MSDEIRFPKQTVLLKARENLGNVNGIFRPEKAGIEIIREDDRDFSPGISPKN